MLIEMHKEFETHNYQESRAKLSSLFKARPQFQSKHLARQSEPTGGDPGFFGGRAYTVDKRLSYLYPPPAGYARPPTRKGWGHFYSNKKHKAVTLSTLLPYVYDSCLLNYGRPELRKI